MSAISPKEAMEKFEKEIPKKVFDCWNQLIISNLKINHNLASSTFKLNDLIQLLCKVMETNQNEIENKGWLDLEHIFISRGWKVVFDKSPYNENYSSCYKFTSR